MKKKISLLLIVVLLIYMAGCRTVIPLQSSDGGTDEKTELRINFATGSSTKTLTYNTGTPITLPDGSIYTNGQIKPVWNYLSNELNITISDVTTQGQKASDMFPIAAANDFSTAEIFGGNVAELYMQYGARGKLINLLDYKEKLPNFTAYLEKYPLIKQQITAYDGNIYHIPYVAEMDEFSKVFYGRHDWINMLLDNDLNAEIKTETKTLDTSYEGYWKGVNQRHQTNIIELQNTAALDGVLTGSVARQVLIDYIDATYPNLEKRSDLYIGETAQYDVDEMVALWRVMRLYPNTLFKKTTGQDGTCDIISYFFRTKTTREEIFKLINYFGGTRVYGTNTYTGKWFTDDTNTLQYSFMQDEVFQGIEYLKDIFSEGLINPDYDNVTSGSDYRAQFYSSDLNVNSKGESTVKQLGFMTFDFIPSTAASSPTGTVQALLPPLTKLPGMKNDTFYHYVEIPRTVMIDGWTISGKISSEKLDKALELLDYFFSEKGSNVQNYGIPDVTADFENLFTLPSGDKVPKLSTWIADQAKIYTNGDVAKFGQEYMGIRLPVGYKADIGFEYQNMVKEATIGYDLYETAQVMTLGYNKSSKLLELSAPCYSFTQQERAQLSTITIGDIQMDMTYLYIKSDKNAVSSTEDIKQSYLKSNVNEFIEIYRKAFNRTQ